MEPDEMKAAWGEMERRLAATQAAVDGFRVERGLDRARAALRPLVASLGFELVQDGIAVLLLVSFLIVDGREPRFAAPAVGLLALAGLAAASAIRQLARAGRIDYAAPVAAVQRELAELRSLRLRTQKWVLLLAPLLWVPLLIVAARGLIGLDVYAGLGWAWVLANLGFGVAFAGIAAWACRRWAARPGGSRWQAALADGLAGRSLTRALNEAREAATFAAEP